MSKYHPSTSSPMPSHPQSSDQSRLFDTPLDRLMKFPGKRDFCPPGLEYLTVVDELVVLQRAISLDVLFGYKHHKSNFRVLNSAGQGIYYASKESGKIMRQFCGNNRSFTMHIWDNYGVEVMRLQRQFACTMCCCPCFLNRMEVEAPPGTSIGRIRQKWHMLQPHFDVLNSHRLIIGKIKGPWCSCGSSFTIFKPDGQTSIGVIKKMSLEANNNFEINFPMGMDPNTKAIMLGACFLIDYMYFELIYE